MKIVLDEGYMFGLGAFETIGVENRHPVFLKEHLDRLEACLDFLHIKRSVNERQVNEFLESQTQPFLMHGVLKIMVSQENTVFTVRPNPYTASQYEKGFLLDYSQVRRNETSPLTAYKTTGYGDCILEKRRALEAGKDDCIFLNTRGELCECTSSNLFFVKEGKLYAPSLTCGMLPGIIRNYLYERYEVADLILSPKDTEQFEECFVTNSLMGIMPVCRIGEYEFKSNRVSKRLREDLKREIGMQSIKTVFL